MARIAPKVSWADLFSDDEGEDQEEDDHALSSTVLNHDAFSAVDRGQRKCSWADLDLDSEEDHDEWFPSGLMTQGQNRKVSWADLEDSEDDDQEPKISQHAGSSQTWVSNADVNHPGSEPTMQCAKM